MNPEIAFRTAAPDDALCLSMLATQVFLDTYATNGINANLAQEARDVYSLAAFTERLNTPNTEIIVAEHSDYLAGFLDLNFSSLCPVSSVEGVEIFRLYIQSHFQQKGVGKRLMSLAEAKTRERHYSHIWLTAWSGNTRAHSFYVALGYQDIGRTQYVFEGKEYENRVFAKSIADS